MSAAYLVMRVDTTTKPPTIVGAAVWSEAAACSGLPHGPAYRWLDVQRVQGESWELAHAAMLGHLRGMGEYSAWVLELLGCPWCAGEKVRARWLAEAPQ